MKSVSIRETVFLCIVSCLVSLPWGPVAANYTFSFPELMLIEDMNIPTPQASVHVGFDNADRLHAVWSEEVNPSIWHIDGTVIQPDMFVLTPFGAVNGNPIYTYDHPFVFRNDFDTSKMYVHILESGGAEYKTAPAQWDLNDLPGTPTVTDLSQFLTSAATGLNRDQVDVLSVGNYIVYAIESYPDIRYNVFDVAADNWNLTESVVSGVDTLLNPRLAKGDDNYVYLAYEEFDGSNSSLRIRRSLNPLQFTPALNLNTTSFNVRSTSMGGGTYNADLAVTGSDGSEKVALVYQDPEAATGIEIWCSRSQSMNWGGTSWSGTLTQLNFLGSATVAMGPSAAYDANGNTLYVVWSDNRIGYDELYGMTSYDGGINFGTEQQLTSNSESIVERPVIATGTQPGALAVAYMRTGGGGTCPYVLVSMPDFYDMCDEDPATAGYWDSWTGVSVDSTSVPPVSPPACYRMATSPVKGQLIHSYGAVEQTGSLDLYFYDPNPTPDPTNPDFIVAMENTNAKGVIRMLGVKNDVNPNNYAYAPDGVNWQDWGVPRSTGWHRIIMTVDESGFLMSLEYQPGITVQYADPGFTAFTDITIDGGDDGDPYFVDDIQVIAIPVLSGGPIPVSSPVTLILMLLGIGSMLIWKIRH